MFDRKLKNRRAWRRAPESAHKAATATDTGARPGPGRRPAHATRAAAAPDRPTRADRGSVAIGSASAQSAGGKGMTGSG